LLIVLAKLATVFVGLCISIEVLPLIVKALK
jgi:hypothetical protein